MVGHLDIVGDLCLLGKPLKAHIIAVRPGHSLNAELSSKILDSVSKAEKTKKGPLAKDHEKKAYVMPDETELDVRRILDVLPHRFPFVMIDRVVSIEGNESLTGIKNVSINEPFFTGHFPGHPVMPGVLQLEAMAQAAGILLLRRGSCLCFIHYSAPITFISSSNLPKCDRITTFIEHPTLSLSL